MGWTPSLSICCSSFWFLLPCDISSLDVSAILVYGFLLFLYVYSALPLVPVSCLGFYLVSSLLCIILLCTGCGSVCNALEASLIPLHLTSGYVDIIVRRSIHNLYRGYLLVIYMSTGDTQ